MPRRGQRHDTIPLGWISMCEASREHGLASRSPALLRRLACCERPRLAFRRYGAMWCLPLGHLVELQRRLAAWRSATGGRRRGRE